MNVTLRDFQPINNWQPDWAGENYECCAGHKGQPKFIVDATTNRRYLNESKEVVRFKCLLLTLGTPVVHPIVSIVNVAYRSLQLATFSHLCMEKAGETEYNFKARLVDAGKDLLKIVATPISLIGLELTALYGLFMPYDGRKLYASIERATYDDFILAPCFQPDPKSHAFGGDVNKKNAF